MSRGSRYHTLHLIREDILAWQRIFSPTGAAQEPFRLATAIKLVWNYCGLRATLLYRISHGLWKHQVPIVPGMLGRLNLSLHGLDIPASTPIGPGLYVPHPVGTVITAKVIGSNVSLIGSITIGMLKTPIFPTIGDDVFIGAGARVLGDIRVGNGANIGANAVVLKDVPDGATAVGIPARLIAPRAEATASGVSGSSVSMAIEEE